MKTKDIYTAENDISQFINRIDFDRIDKHPNILIAARLWDDRRYNAAKICYLFMRMIDDLVDDRKARKEAISCLEREALTNEVNSWIECLLKSPGNDPFLEELNDTISNFKIPLELFYNFARSMIFDLNHDGFATFDEFLDYSEGASVAPASIFVHLCCLQEVGGTYVNPGIDVISAARPCAIFSYIVHIIRDFQADQLSNLNYISLDILAKHQLEPSDLKEIAMTNEVPAAFRDVIREYLAHAMEYERRTLLEIEKLSGRLDERYLLSLQLIHSLYKMVFDRIDPTHGDFTTEALNPNVQEIRERVLEVCCPV